ncbi:RING-H2 finger protein ATL3-like [Primulina huaijiensis]|uniref:RING-H2 finger protein ATL3-like n=1 Tax=Primulina huaijiensis TaxID=1492673 RepID=UPI003CC787D7
MTDSGSGKLGDSSVIELAGKIMVVTLILLSFVIIFVFCLHLYAKWFWYRRQVNPTTTTRRRRRLDFSSGYQEAAAVAALRRGLDPSVLKTIPITLFDPKEFKDGLECAVCLCEVTEGEKTRLLPKCNHGFHVECIDMWFQSHSTCPLCRNPVANQCQSSENSAADSTLETTQQIPAAENPSFSTETPNFPTNVLFWGNESQVSTFGPNSVEEDHQNCAINEPSSSSPSSSSRSNRPDGILVIDIPTQINEEEEQKSPMPTRLRSLKRLLSGNRRTIPSSPRNFDLEQGIRGRS